MLAPSALHEIVVDASYRDGWAGIAAVADGHDVLFSAVVPARSSPHAERLALQRALDRVTQLGWAKGVILSDCSGAVLSARFRCQHHPPGWVVRCVPRKHVASAHRIARAELRLWARINH